MAWTGRHNTNFKSIKKVCNCWALYRMMGRLSKFWLYFLFKLNINECHFSSFENATSYLWAFLHQSEKKKTPPNRLVSSHGALIVSSWNRQVDEKQQRHPRQNVRSSKFVFDRNKGEKGASTLKINHWINSLDII